MARKRKPNGYWTKERCIEEARKHDTVNSFRKGNNAAYVQAWRHDYLNECCEHMKEIRKPGGYWTKPRVLKEAKKYSTRVDFRYGNTSAYGAAQRGGYIDECCKHMKEVRKPDGYWTKPRVLKEAKKYDTRTSFMRESSGAYYVALTGGYLDECCKHMVELHKPHGYWTKRRLIEEARKYDTRLAFQKGSPSAHATAHVKGYLDECCKHMKRVGNRWKRGLYAMIFDDNTVYVGLTYSFERRWKRHSSEAHNKEVRERMEKFGGCIWVEYEGLYSIDQAAILEEEILQEYIESGYTKLNKAHTGSLGGNTLKWTEEKCIEEARKYDTRSAFQNGNSSAYNAARRDGHLDKCCKHMKEGRKPNGYWTKERLIKEAKKYDTRTAFFRGSQSAFSRAYTKGYLDECCKHMKEGRKPNGYWTKERLIKEAKKYDRRSAFKKGSRSAYAIAIRDGYLNVCCEHMK